MKKTIRIPPSFSLIQKGRTSLLLKDEFKSLLLQQGMEDIKGFLKKTVPPIHYLKGRTPHPSLPLQNGKNMVIRQYAHGGLLKGITRNLYLIGMRSFRELALTEEIRTCGIPTIQPIGAIHHRIFFSFYQPYLLSLELSGAKDLIQYFQEIGAPYHKENLLLKRKMICSVGLLIRQFHQAGFFHGDLQLKNILIAKDQPCLIDFDRSYRKPTLSLHERMKNLLRLNRSAEKWKRSGLPITRTDQWRFFLAYAGEDQTIRGAMEKALRIYTLRFLFYRMGWTLERILGSQRSRGQAKS